MISDLSRQPSAGQPSADDDQGMRYMSVSVLPVGWRRGTAREGESTVSALPFSQGKHKWMQKLTIGTQMRGHLIRDDAHIGASPVFTCMLVTLESMLVMLESTPVMLANMLGTL